MENSNRMSDYRNIRNLQELQYHRRLLSSRIDHQEIMVMYKLRCVWDFLSPSNLLDMGCKNALITMGKQGCAYCWQGSVGYEDIIPVQVADTTAAGDSFIGGLCARLCDGAEFPDAVRYATAVSALTVSRPGASVSIPTCAEVEAFLRG